MTLYEYLDNKLRVYGCHLFEIEEDGFTDENCIAFIKNQAVYNAIHDILLELQCDNYLTIYDR